LKNKRKDQTQVADTMNGSGWKRAFFTIWSGQAVSLLGSSLAGFALVWWLASTSTSATVLAGATLRKLEQKRITLPAGESQV
jgi:hypothetical protein